MINETLKNENVELSVHISKKETAVLTISGEDFYEFQAYTFENESEIDWLIARLKQLKTEHDWV